MLPKDLPLNGASQQKPPHRFNARIIIFFFALVGVRHITILDIKICKQKSSYVIDKKVMNDITSYRVYKYVGEVYQLIQKKKH